jgi:hypothetical protein
MKRASWLKRRRWERRLDAEFRFHLESQISDYVRQGFSREEAELRARREFGPVDLTKDECRDERPLEWFDHLLRDIRYACRSLRKSPGFAAAAMVTLALGIGANTAIFSVVYAVLLKPLPYAQPDQIYSVEVVIPERRNQFSSLPGTVQAYLEWRKANTAFAAMSALRPWECNLTSDGEPERLGGARVSANFFSFLGVPIARGRGFSTDEDRPGNERVVVVSDALWRRRYGADPALIGRKININGESHLVVGIAPPSLLVPTGTLLHPLVPFAPRIDIWKPLAPATRGINNESWDHGVLVRLRQGANPEQGRQQLQAILNAMLRAQMPGIKTELLTQLVPIREIYAGKVRLRLLLILAASALLLLTACTNIANLFLARVASRTSEFAMRIALGAGRARILSQTLTETTLLAVLGGAMGAVLAQYGAGLLASYGPDDVRLLAPAIRAEIRRMDPNLPIPAMRTMRDILSATVAQRRFQMMLTSLFALVALLLGAVGLYGVVSYSVACRTRDIGLRIALGATRTDVMRWVFSNGMKPVLIGLLAGVCGAVAIARTVRSLLFGITPADPLSLGAVVLILLLTSGLACYLPARRAAALDPLTALRHE